MVVPVETVLTIGDHIPVIAGLFVELVGNIGAVANWHTFGIVANVGVIRGFTVIVPVAFLNRLILFFPFLEDQKRF